MIAERYLARRFAEGKEEGKKQGREEGRAESLQELARWLDANPVIKKAIESGDANPPPFLNGSPRDQQ